MALRLHSTWGEKSPEVGQTVPGRKQNQGADRFNCSQGVATARNPEAESEENPRALNGENQETDQRATNAEGNRGQKAASREEANPRIVNAKNHEAQQDEIDRKAATEENLRVAQSQRAMSAEDPGQGAVNAKDQEASQGHKIKITAKVVAEAKACLHT